MSCNLDRQVGRVDNPPAMTLVDYLKATLRERGWSMTDLARRAGVSKQAVGQWLSEDEFTRVSPRPIYCEKIAAALGVDPDYILELAGHRRRSEVAGPPDPGLAEVIALWPTLTEERRDSIRLLAVASARTADNPTHSVGGNRSDRRVTGRTADGEDGNNQRLTRRYPRVHGVLSRAAA